MRGEPPAWWSDSGAYYRYLRHGLENDLPVPEVAPSFAYSAYTMKGRIQHALHCLASLCERDPWVLRARAAGTPHVGGLNYRYVLRHCRHEALASMNRLGIGL